MIMLALCLCTRAGYYDEGHYDLMEIDAVSGSDTKASAIGGIGELVVT